MKNKRDREKVSRNCPDTSRDRKGWDGTAAPQAHSWSKDDNVIVTWSIVAATLKL